MNQSPVLPQILNNVLQECTKPRNYISRIVDCYGIKTLDEGYLVCSKRLLCLNYQLILYPVPKTNYGLFNLRSYLQAIYLQLILINNVNI